MKFNIKSRKGFTLIELLVVIGILAVLAAIAIPSVAGLIDRANVSADKTNSNEMTNALERFTSEYELYCQDIASGVLKDADNNGTPDDMDSAQGRVFNVTGAKTRSDIETLEVAQNTPITDDMVAIYRDTKYPVNAKTMQLIVKNYTKTSSSTFEPKQSDMHYWYSPDCGVVVVAEPNKTAAELDKYVISGMDAKGNDITSDSVNAKWVDLTNAFYLSIGDNANNVTPDMNSNIVPEGATYYVGGTFDPFTRTEDAIVKNATAVYTAGETFPSISDGDICLCNGYVYIYNYKATDIAPSFSHNPSQNGWGVASFSFGSHCTETVPPILEAINGKTITSLNYAYQCNHYIKTPPAIPQTVTSMEGTFFDCCNLETKAIIPQGVSDSENIIYAHCTKLGFQ